MLSRQTRFKINLKYRIAIFAIGTTHFYLSIDSARSQDGGIYQVGPVSGENNNSFSKRLDSIHLSTEHRYQRVADIISTHGLPCSKNRFCFVNKNKRHLALFLIITRLFKNFPYLTLRLPKPHVKNFGAFDMDKSTFEILIRFFFLKLTNDV